MKNVLMVLALICSMFGSAQAQNQSQAAIALTNAEVKMNGAATNEKNDALAAIQAIELEIPVGSNPPPAGWTQEQAVNFNNHCAAGAGSFESAESFYYAGLGKFDAGVVAYTHAYAYYYNSSDWYGCCYYAGQASSLFNGAIGDFQFSQIYSGYAQDAYNAARNVAVGL